MSLTTVDGSLISSGAITLTTQVTGTLPEANGGTGTTVGYCGFKNKIINGGMVVSQRGATNVVAGGGSTYIAADRFNVFNYFGSGQVNTAVSTSIVPTGYAYSLGLTVNTAVPLSGTTGYAINVAQTIEGFNISDCYTQTVTLSFWVRSSITGTYSVSFSNATNVGLSATSRIYVTNYTINAANTWEQKTINVNLSTGTASGTWLSDNGAGLNLAWGLGAESNRKGNTYLDTWGTIGTTYNVQSSAQTQWAATSGATFYITGVQLEKGSTATSFDYRPYGTELQLCQRYLPATAAIGGSGEQGGQMLWISTTTGWGTFIPIVQPRVVPTGFTGTNTEITVRASGGSNTVSSAVSFAGAGLAQFLFNVTIVAAAGVANASGFWYLNTTGAKVLWTGCEL